MRLFIPISFKMRNTLIILCIIAFQSVLFSQNCNNILIGEVADFHNREPLTDAIILIKGNGKYFQSDDFGKFTIKNLCNGIMELEVSHPFCDTKSITVEIKGNTYKKISLEHHLEELDEITVRANILNKTNSTQEAVLNSEKLERYSGNNLGDALKQINGLSTLSTGSNIVKPIIQGLGGSRILILNNGIRMQDMEWGVEHAPNIDINTADKVTVIKGATALQFGGDAIGGVILLEQDRIMKKDSIYGNIILNGASNGRGGNISTKLIKTYKSGYYIKGQASYKKFGDAQAPDYILSNTGVSQYAVSLDFGRPSFEKGWNAYYSYFKTSIGILRASHIGNIDDLINAINSSEPSVVKDFTYAINSPYQKVSHHLGKLNYHKRFEGLGKLTIQYDVQQNQRYEYDIRRGKDKYKASLDLKLSTQTLSADFKMDADENNKYLFGLLGRYQENFANPTTGVRRLIPDYDKVDFGVFATTQYRFSDNGTIDAGIRYDFSKIDAKKYYRTSRWKGRGYNRDFSDIVIKDIGTQLLVNPILEYHNFSGSAGIQYNFKNKNQFRFNYALSQRTPNPSELFSEGLHHSAARIELGDLRIGSETSHRLSSSLNKQYDKWGYDVSPYINFISDFILLEPTGVEFTIRGAFPVWGYRQTDSRFLGVDASIYSVWASNWRTDHQFSTVKGRDVKKKIFLVNTPSARLKNAITFSKKKKNNLNIELQSEYIFRQNEYPANINVPWRGREIELNINSPPKAYHLLKLDSEIKFLFQNKNTFTIGLTANNLLNTKYRDYLNRLRFFSDDLGRNITVRLKLNY